MKNFIPALIWAIIIFCLSASSEVKIPTSLSGFTGIDKIGHLVMYAIFSGLFLFGVTKTKVEISGKFNELIIPGVCSAYGIIMEILQTTVFAGRYFEVLDIIANIIGSFIGLFVYKYFIIKKS